MIKVHGLMSRLWMVMLWNVGRYAKPSLEYGWSLNILPVADHPSLYGVIRDRAATHQTLSGCPLSPSKKPAYDECSVSVIDMPQSGVFKR